MMRVRSILTVGLLALTTACAVNPATGERELMLVSRQQEIQMGREAHPQIMAAYGAVDDPELQAYVSGLGQEMAAISERPELPWNFEVLDEWTVNAFALPGGFIYVTRGILAHFSSEAELAGVLGHEIGHVTARHSASQMSRQQLQQVGIGVGMIVSETFREYGGIAVAGLQLMNLSYSRDDELQADRLGLRYMSRVGYEAEALIGVFEMLASVSGSAGDGRAPEWALTHPYPENRQENMRREITATGIDREGIVDRDEYLDMIDGMVFGANPRNGFFQGSRFLHPDLEFEVTFPQGWKTVNQTQVVAAVSPEENAVVMLGIADDASSAQAGLDVFASSDGVSVGTPSRTTVSGLPAVRAPFGVTTEQGELRGEVMFLEYGGLVYRILGYSSEAEWGRYASSVRGTMSSFAPLTDPEMLGVEPMRVDIVTLGDATSLTSFVQRNPQPVEVDVLARINRTSPDAVLSRGTRIKTVVGEPVAR